MKKEIALKLMDTFSILSEPLNAAAELIEQIEDRNEKIVFRKGIAEIMARIYTDLEFPIICQYPELDPDSDRI